jgi:8-oxo-dGTP diphosphatase
MPNPPFEFALASVAVFVEYQGKILMGNRIHNTTAVGVSEWSVTGGKVDFGETPEQAAIRETKEECGLDITDLEFLTYKTECFPSFGKHFICLYFRAKATSADAKLMEPEKVSQWVWIEPKQCPANSFGKINEVLSEFYLQPKVQVNTEALQRLKDTVQNAAPALRAF